MLGVDGIDLPVANLRAEQQMTARHNGFLIGKSQLGSCLQRRNGRLQADGTGNAVQHHVGSGTGQSDYRFRTRLNLGAVGSRLVKRLAQRLGGLPVEHRDQWNVELRGLLGK